MKFNPTSPRTLPKAIVRTRATWSDAWQEQPNLFCESISWELYGIGSASLIWHYGQMTRAGDATPQAVQKLELLNHWVSIEYMPENGDGPDFWYGIVTSVAQDTHGGMQGTVSGDQRFICHAPEILFTRVQMTSSLGRAYTSPQENDIEVPFGITFNEVDSRASSSSGQQIFGNRILSPDVDRFWIGDFRSTNRKAWTLRNIVRYLADYVEQSFPDAGPFIFPDVYFPMNGYTPVNVVTHGRTVYDVLNEVIDRRRGLAWTINPLNFAADPIGFFIKVVSLSPVDVELPGDDLKANTDTIDIEIYDAQDIERCVVTSDALTQYDQVIVEGGSIGTVFTVPMNKGFITGTVIVSSDEYAALFEKYKAAASNLPGYNQKDLAEQKALNDKLRMSDEFLPLSTFMMDNSYLSYVFVRPSEIDGSYSFTGSFTQYQAGNVIREQMVYQQSVKLENYLPMTDASGSVMRPIICDVRTPTGVSVDDPFNVDSSLIFRDLSTVGAVAENEADRKNGTPVSFSLQVADIGPTYTVLPDGPYHQMMGHSRQLPWGAPGTVSEGAAVSEVTTSTTIISAMYVTLYARSPRRVRVVYPNTNDPKHNADQSQKLLLRAGDDYRFDAIKPYTILGPHTDGSSQGPRFNTQVEVLRDDRTKMRTVARLAWEWYRKKRQALSISWRQVLPYFEIRVGKLVTSLATSTTSTAEPAHLETLAGEFSAITDETGAFPLDENNEPIQDETSPVAEPLEAIGGGPFTLLQDTIAQAVGDGIPFSAIGGGAITLLHDPNEPLEWITEPINTIISSVSVNFATGTTSLDTQFSEIDFELVGGR